MPGGPQNRICFKTNPELVGDYRAGTCWAGAQSCLAKCRSSKKKVLVGGTRPAAPAVELNEVTAQLHPQIWERMTTVRQALGTCALPIPEGSGTHPPYRHTLCPLPLKPGVLHTAAKRSDTSPVQKQQDKQLTLSALLPSSFLPYWDVPMRITT